jgi:hypothetical protein
MKMAEVAVAAVVKTARTPSEKMAMVCTATAHLVPMLAGSPIPAGRNGLGEVRRWGSRAA